MLLAGMVIGIFVCVGVLVWALWPDESKRAMRRRLYSEVSEERPESSGTRLVNQLVKLWQPVNRHLPTGWYAASTTKALEVAGYRLPALHFFVIQETGAVTGAMAYLVFFGGFDHLNMGWLLLLILAGFMVPRVYLMSRISNRRLTISRDLPEVVDLLTLCISAGSDFMTAMGRIVREFRPCPVRDELAIVLQEVRVGKRRRDALRGFAARLQTPEAMSFARTLIQVDRMGTGLAEALKVLSEDMRIQRYHWAERFAQKAPMKMLLPLLLSLAAALIIVAGPILVQFFRGGFGLPTGETTSESQMPFGQQAARARSQR
jgi:tight adherence protein C